MIVYIVLFLLVGLAKFYSFYLSLNYAGIRRAEHT